jgi:uncharacterized protein YbgA (DUF1722 family)
MSDFCHYPVQNLGELVLSGDVKLLRIYKKCCLNKIRKFFNTTSLTNVHIHLDGYNKKYNAKLLASDNSRYRLY